MLESIVAWVLNNYIGEYLQLNTDQFSIAFLQGQVDLTNVPIKKQALRKFDIPIQVKNGIIGKLQLQVPLLSRSSPWVLKIEDFLVVLGPCNIGYDVKCVEQYRQQKQEQMLDEIEQQHKKQLLAQIGIQFMEDVGQDTGHWWGASLLSTISNNIQVRIENIQIKYECMEYEFGIKIQSLAIETTNAQWRPGFIEVSEGANIFKKFDIKGFSIHWNPVPRKDNNFTGTLLGMSLAAIKAELKKNFANHQNGQTNYILQPLSLDMRLEKNSSRHPLRTNVPRFKIDIRSRKIELELNKQQIRQIQQFSENWVLFERARPHRKWRPILAVLDSPKEWWRFAIGRVLDEIHSRNYNFRSAKLLCARLKLLNAYSRAYQCRLKCYLEGKLKTANPNASIFIPKLSLPDTAKTENTTTLIKQIEHGDDFSYQDLRILREAVYNKLSQELKNIEEGNAENHTLKRDDSPFEIIPTTSSRNNEKEHPLTKNIEKDNSNIQQGQGWLNWMTSLLQGQSLEESTKQAEDFNEAIYLNLRPPSLDKHSLSPELEEIERRMEAELLQVLNESFEDSNILRRDNLLAELVLNFSHVFLRISKEKPSKPDKINENGETTTMLTFDFDKVCSRIQLSPKEHRIELSLTVKDLSVQQIQFQSSAGMTGANTCSSSASEQSQITPNKNSYDIIAQEDEVLSDNACELDSLACGFHNNLKTRLLLTVGRIYDEDEEPKEKRKSRKRKNKKSFTEQKRDNCILKLFYKRLAPKLEVYNELNMICAPLSIVADELALNRILDIFDSNENDEDVEQQQQQEVNNDFSPLPETIVNQIFASFTCPELIIELRSQKAANNCLFSPHFVPNSSSKKNSMENEGSCGLGLDETPATDSITFVRAIIQKPYLTLTQHSGCNHLAKMDLTFDSFLLEDLFENQTEWPLLRILELHSYQQEIENQTLSTSCPDNLNSLSVMDDLYSTANLSAMNNLNFAAMRKRGSSEKESDYAKIDYNVVHQKLGNLNYNSNSGGTNTHKKIFLSRMHTLKFIFIPKEHPDWATHYKKANCKIVGHFNDQQTNVELNINRRTWTLLFDFFGLTSITPEIGKTSSKLESYLVNIELSAANLLLAMNFPQNKTQLSICKIQRPKLDIQLDLNIIDNPHIVSFSAHSLSLMDLTPIYGRVYNEILKIESKRETLEKPSIHLNLLKYRNSDASTIFTREFDILLALEIDTPTHYIHTQRFFYALMDFWLQFAELFDKVTLYNAREMDKRMQDSTKLFSSLLKTRCQLNLELQDRLNLYIPQHHCSSQSILFTCDKIQGNNTFIWASSLKTMLNQQQLIQIQQQHHPQLNRSQSSSSTKLLTDCLLDAMNLHCHNLSVNYGTFICLHRKNDNNANLLAGRSFSEYSYQTNSSQTVMEANGSILVLDIYRNLSAAISHNVPALFILFRLQNAIIKFTSDFYKLFRGCMDHNIGEQIVPQVWTFPLELLELPEITSPLEEREKYSTFSMRVSLKKVLINLSTPISPIELTKFEEFAKLHIRSGKLTYDSFADSQAEFDFICENASMEDSRPPESCKNVSESFKKVLKKRSSNFIGVTRKDSMENINESFGNTTTNISPKHFSDDRKLLFEFHIQMRKNDCPVFSMIFIRTRIYLLMDWIRQLQTFLLLYSEFKPPSEPSEKLLNDALLLQPASIEMPKDGVLLRRISPSSTHYQQKNIRKTSINSASFSTKEKEHSKMIDDTIGKFSMKITLKDCELIALENPSREDSFALIMLTTGVILSDNLKQVELVESQYEIQQFSLHWRSMRSESSCAQLTKDTSATISISYEDEHKLEDLLNPAGNGNKIEANQPFLLNKRRHLPSQIIHCQFGQPLIFRGSLKDYFIVKQIYDAAYTFWENSQEIEFFWANSSAMQTLDSVFPAEFIPSEKTLKSNSQNQQKFILNVDNLCIKIFKEATMTNQRKDCSWESMAPFLKININEMNLTSTLFTTKIRLMLGIDYYRHMNAPLGGWEPVLESCQITDFIAIFVEKLNTWNLKLKPAEGCVMELNLTQTFIQEFIDFQSEDIASIYDILNAPGNEGLEKLRNELYSSNADDINDESCSSKASDYIPAKLTKNFGDGNLYSNLLAKKIIDPKQQFRNLGINIDLQLDFDAGIGISLIGNDEHIEGNDDQQHQQEELIYARFSGFQANLQKRRHIYQLSACINSIRMDNQIFGADRFHFFFCDPSALRDDEPLAGPLPALNFEISYTCSEFWDAYESFRLKLCNSCILLDEQLLWRLINFGINIYSHRVQKDGQQKQMEKELRNCYFGVFQLELGEISLSVMTIDKNILPPKLCSLKENYSDKLVLFSFENALVNLAPFWAHRCYTTLGNLFANVGDFYIEELKRQKLNIVVSMDAFGNPIGFANEFKEGVEGLLFEGDLAGFTFGIGYGVANSISKMASSMAQGVGSLTFDDKHEQFRRKMIRSSNPDESNAFTHLYGGLKGFGVGVFGGLTAIPKNTMTATKQDGFTGVFRGVTTGAIDTLTKPIQGALDLVGGTASALKEIVGAPLVRRAHFPKNRLRLPRVCSSLNGLLPQFSNELAVGQQELLRITGMFTLNDENRLLCIVPFLERFNADGTRRFVLQRALICIQKCYIIRDVHDESTSVVIYRILFQNLRKVQLANQEQLQKSSQNRPSTSKNQAENNTGISTRLAAVEVFYHPTTSKEQMKNSASSSNFYLRSSAKPNQQQIMATQTPALTLWCTDLEKAQLLCNKIMNAKAQFDQRGFGKRIRATPSTTSSKKKPHSSSIFTI